MSTPGNSIPRTAAGLAPLLQLLQLRAIEKTDFEQRIAKLEKQLMRLKTENAEREKEKQKTGEYPYARRPPQAVKPYASNDGKTADES